MYKGVSRSQSLASHLQQLKDYEAQLASEPVIIWYGNVR